MFVFVFMVSSRARARAWLSPLWILNLHIYYFWVLYFHWQVIEPSTTPLPQYVNRYKWIWPLCMWTDKTNKWTGINQYKQCHCVCVIKEIASFMVFCTCRVKFFNHQGAPVSTVTIPGHRVTNLSIINPIIFYMYTFHSF